VTLKIQEITSPNDLKIFVRFPFSLYRGNPFWVPLLDEDELHNLSPDQNPAFNHCHARFWLAYRKDRVVGRIAAIFNPLHIENWKQNYLRFGWIDFVDDLEVSCELLKVVEDWARELGMDAVHGPMGFTDMDRQGMLIEGFDKLGTMATIYNHPYYIEHMEKLGYNKDIDWLEYTIEVPNPPDEIISKAAHIALRRNHLRVAPIRKKKDYLPYAPALFKLFIEAYQLLYGFVPLTPAQINAAIKQYFGFIKPGFVPLVLDSEDNLVGFGIAMPSLSKALQKAGGRLFPLGFYHLLNALRKNDQADLYLVAVKPEYQGQGVNAILMNEMCQTFIRHGIVRVESNPELENNTLVQSQWKYFNRQQHKRRRCWIKSLQ
jgi:GNAT superfamily N-acetyltransferase